MLTGGEWRLRFDTVRRRLLLLVLAVVIPLTLFAVLTIAFALRLERRAAERRVLDAARTVSLALDREFASAEAALKVLATSTALRQGDLDAFRAQAITARTSEEAWILLFDAQAMQVVNTGFEVGTPPVRRANPERVAQIFASRQSDVSDLYVGALTRRHIITIDVPVVWEDRVHYVLSQAFYPEYFERVLREYPWPADWVLGIFDGTGLTVARSHRAEDTVGRPARPELLAAAARRNEGSLEHDSRDGIRVHDAFTRSRRAGWLVAVAAPVAALNAPVYKGLAGIGAGAALALGAAAVLAFVISRRISAPLAAAADAARSLGRGEPLSEVPSGPVEIRDISAALHEAAVAVDTRQRALAQLQAITDVALTHLKPEDFLQRLLERVRDFVGADTVALLTTSPDQGDLVIRATLGFQERIARRQRIPMGTGFAGRVASERRAILVSPVNESDLVSSFLADQGLGALFGVPLLVEDRMIGVLHVGWRGPHTVTEGELDLLQRVAGRAALGLERANLFESVQDANRELERLLRAAELANTAKDQFLATVSHELRTPLNAILGWAWLLRAGTLDAQARERALETIERSGKAQARLIEDLLDVSRIVARTLRIERAPVSFRTVVSAALDTLRPAATGKGIEIRLQAGSRELVVEGDRNRLEQITLNLVSNAVKFTPAGGRVEVLLREVDGEAELVVRDTGIGIAAEVLPYVFDHFRQADQSSTRRHGGLGLGLTIVKQLVELHQGTVRAESDGPERGATFVVRLPLAQRHEAVPPAGAPPALPRRRLGGLESVRILLVDDEEDNLTLLTQGLRLAGADVVAVRSAARALQIFEMVRPDVLVTDLSMPEQDGYDLLARLRARFADGEPPIPAIALTAHAQADDRQRAFAAGFAAHVAKPVDPDVLVASVRAVCAAAR
jgi:signal transduction histidine kinase/CheY-like chemotaxis protein